MARDLRPQADIGDGGLRILGDAQSVLHPAEREPQDVDPGDRRARTFLVVRHAARELRELTLGRLPPSRQGGRLGREQPAAEAGPRLDGGTCQTLGEREVVVPPGRARGLE